MRQTCLALAVISGAIAGVLGLPPGADAAPAGVPVQVLAINDLHGRLALPHGSESRFVLGPGPDGVYGADDADRNDDHVTRVGGAYNVAAAVDRLRDDFRQQAGGSAASYFVSSGDLIDESGSASDPYLDEPTIEMVNALGLDVSAVGDDDLYRGTRELRRISAATDGHYTDDVTACDVARPGVDGCFGEGEHAFTGASFPYLAANMVSRETGEPALPPYQVFVTPERLQVAFIGVLLQGAAAHVLPEGITDVEFLDEAETVNRWVAELRGAGVEAIGVLLHEGGAQSSRGGPKDANGCEGLTGPIGDINARIDPAVDFIVAGHKHSSFNCLLPSEAGPRLVTQAGAYGRMVTDIRLTLDPVTGDVDRVATYSAVNVPSLHDPTPDRDLQAILSYWTRGPGNERPGARTDGGSGSAAGATSTAGNGIWVWAAAALVASTVLLVVILGAPSVRSRRNRRPRMTING